MENTIAVKKEDSLRKAKPQVATSVDEENAAPESTEQVPLPKLCLPNTFTPNGDGTNDTYEVGCPGNFRQITTRITSLKTGQVVYRTDVNEPWTAEGQEDGYYIVAVEAITLDGRTVSEGKVVWLNRDRMN